MENRELIVLEDLLLKASAYYSDIVKRNKKESILFNPLTFFDIGETKHSFLIAKLLDTNGEHGQGNTFLKLFLNTLNIEYEEQHVWKITAEKDRVDILLKRENPRAVVIIENKSNNAKDQENQIYRYWYDHIYMPIEYIKTENQYQIIYLVAQESKKPTKNSLTKPRDWENVKVNKVPIEPKLFLFNREIVLWLKACFKALEVENIRMRVFIEQYIELVKKL